MSVYWRVKREPELIKKAKTRSKPVRPSGVEQSTPEKQKQQKK
jgi:hypothetical protein